jgi:hypothetical protein
VIPSSVQPAPAVLTAVTTETCTTTGGKATDHVSKTPGGATISYIDFTQNNGVTLDITE